MPVPSVNVSVVMCTFNGAKYLKEQIVSIIHQTYPIYELIIQDDHSADETVDIIRDYCLEYSFIKLYQNPKSLGINANFFSAITYASGDYIALSDQDDIWEKDKIENQITAIGEKLFCTGISTPFYHSSDLSNGYDKRIPNCNLIRFLFNTPSPGHTFLFKKSFLQLLPDISEVSSWFMYDVILQIVAAANNNIVFVDKKLVNCRRHSTNATSIFQSDNSHTIPEKIHYFVQLLRMYSKTCALLKQRLQRRCELIRNLPTQNKTTTEALKIAEIYMKSPLWKKIYYSLLLRKKILYTQEKNKLNNLLKSIFFPIYCAIYFK